VNSVQRAVVQRRMCSGGDACSLLEGLLWQQLQQPGPSGLIRGSNGNCSRGGCTLSCRCVGGILGSWLIMCVRCGVTWSWHTVQ